jgi:membrane associated rhomboid family serine protease
MLPLRDSVRPERTPFFNWLILFANVGVFLYMALVLKDPQSQQDFAERFGLVPGRVIYAFSHPRIFLDAPWPAVREAVLPFFTHVFVHGGLAHLIGNMWFLLIFGDNVEGRLGHKNYLAFYFVCGIVAAGLHIASSHAGALGVLAGDSGGGRAVLDAPMVGASGAIAGVLGGYVVMFPRSRVLTIVPPIFVFEISAWVFLGLWFVGQFLLARMTAEPGAGVSVAYWAHVGGFAAGLLLGLLAPRRPRDAAPARWR